VTVELATSNFIEVLGVRRSIALRPLVQATIFPGLREALLLGSIVLMEGVGLALLIACSNVANLLLARHAVHAPRVAGDGAPLRAGGGTARDLRREPGGSDRGPAGG
jgi:hypothetical protein